MTADGGSAADLSFLTAAKQIFELIRRLTGRKVSSQHLLLLSKILTEAA